MGKRRQNKKNGFQTGHAFLANKDATLEKIPANCPLQVKRLERSEFLDNTHQDGEMIVEKDPENQPILNLKVLRPRAGYTLEENVQLQSVSVTTVERAEMELMKLFHPKKLEYLWNTSFRHHLKMSPGCDGWLLFDEKAEIKKGLCFKEQLKCSKCTFRSERVSLYQEVPSSTRGCKAAAPNLGTQVGLSHTPAGNQDLRHIFNAAGIAAPARSGMQSLSDKVLDAIINVNTEDMERIRREIRMNNVRKGFTMDTPIMIEGDAQYNNALWSGGGKTPFQPATQAVYTISENETKSKKIIALHVTNKLCGKCGGKKAAGGPECEGCSANVPADHTIGDESHMVKECLVTMGGDTEIKYMTTDQDSQSFTGLQKGMTDMGMTTVPEKLFDTIHLSKSLRRAVNKEKFSTTFFPLVNDFPRDKIQNRFALALSKRCQAEYAASLQKFGCDTSRNINQLSYATDAILSCFQGDHALCRKYSLVCNGKGPKLLTWRNKIVVLDMSNQEDEEKVRALIKTRLGRQALLRSRFGTNTQKSESVNSSYVRSLPKFKTFKRNAKGRLHSRAHLLNNGRCLSTVSIASHLGIKMYLHSRVVRQLHREEEHVIYDKQRQAGLTYKVQRARKIFAWYKLYSQKTPKESYSTGMQDPTVLRKLLIRKRSDHTYSK
jgi:hypothetical protein